MDGAPVRIRFPLAWRILLFTAITPIVLTVLTLDTVNRTISREVRAGIQDNLTRASLVFENILAARASKLSVAAHVIVRDPRFFSILAIGGSSGDPHYRVTVERVAGAFDDLTTSDLFEVVDRGNGTLASVGRTHLTSSSREAIVKAALAGHEVSGILAAGDHHYQVTALPVRVDRRVTGVLLLGAAIDQALARELKTLTHSEVTFLSGTVVTGSSFASRDEASAARGALARPATAPASAQDAPVFEVTSGEHVWLTLARPIPGSDIEARQSYVMQRSLDQETAFLREMQRSLLNLGALAAFAALLAGFVVAAQITRPVRRLMHGAEEMGRGNYQYPLGRPGSDEIGYLSQRFEEMREHEQNRYSRLEEDSRQKSEFISLANHELRTPITVIKSYHEMLMNGDLGELTAHQQKAIEAIHESVGRLENLADKATHMTESTNGSAPIEISECRVAELVERAVRAVRTEGRNRKVELQVTIADDLGAIHADGKRITQALANLVRNAVQFTPDGGSVCVTACGESGELVIRVTDTGIGIPEERLPDLFDKPFLVRESKNHHSSSTLEFESAGLGFGLPIARGNIQAHGGTLEVKSHVGEGSTFTIRIPCQPPAADSGLNGGSAPRSLAA